MIQQMIRTCPDCSGTGKAVSNSDICIECNGRKYNIKNKSVDVKLNNNLNKNNEIKIPKKGHNFRNFKTTLIINITIKNHDLFIKDNNDLHLHMDIKLYQLLFGLHKSIKHLDNRLLYLNIPKFEFENFDDDLVYLIQKEGMNENGNLLIHFNIVNLDLNKLEENEKTVLKKILVKCDLDEFKEEVSILKIKNKLVKTKNMKIDMESYIKSKESKNRKQYDDEQPECVQQ